MSTNDRKIPSDLMPLSPSFFHILLSLGEGERHGYALKREIARRTDGKLKLGPGMLYGSISKMLELGLIEESADRPDPISTTNADATIASPIMAAKEPNKKQLVC